MSEKLEDILRLVEKPGRYTGGEVNSVKKDHNTVSLKVALAFPDLYEIGISNLGLQILYHILNDKDHIAAERVYAPWKDMEDILRKEEIPLSSLESNLPLSSFNIVGFSIQHELGFTNLLNMLDLSGIPLLSSDRGEKDPLIIAGGPSAFNPEPLASFIDAFLIGDGEEAVLDICDTYLKWKEGSGSKGELLSALSTVKGVYVPSLFEVKQEGDSRIKSIAAKNKDYHKVSRRVLADLESAYYPTSFLVPNVAPVHERVPLEIARGCSRFCHFCQAGYTYLPVRERSPEKICELSDSALKETGMDEAALLSLSTGDYSCLDPLLTEITSRYRDRHVNISFPSLRVDTMTPPIMRKMKESRSKSFTIAPEAGSQRLRDLINKGVTEEQILNTAAETSKAGCQSLKLYFMIGLPTETHEDLDAIIELSRKILKTGRKEGGLKKITVNISSFIPKPHTPFQWVAQDSIEETSMKLDYLKKNVKDKGISLKWQDPFMSLLEGVFSRGDRRAGDALLKAFQLGCRFDSWGDMISREKWNEAFTGCGIDTGVYLREREKEELLPWNMLDTGVTTKFLLDELERSGAGRLTEDCRYAKCSLCGVCDYKIIRIESFKGHVPPSAERGKSFSSPVKSRIRVKYTSEGRSALLGHIDCMQGIIKMIRRAGISLVYSEGFHPSPRISFTSPIPLGTESLSEYFDMEIEGTAALPDLLARFNDNSPSGMNISEVTLLSHNSPSLSKGVITERYLISAGRELIGEEQLQEGVRLFSEAAKWPALKKSKKGEKEIDLKGAVGLLSMDGEFNIKMDMAAAGGRKMKPEDAFCNIFKIPPEKKKGLRIIKTDTFFAS